MFRRSMPSGLTRGWTPVRSPRCARRSGPTRTCAGNEALERRVANMWGRKTSEPAPSTEAKSDEKPPQRLRDALRQARLESAERTGVIVDMRDADVARLEIL